MTGPLITVEELSQRLSEVSVLDVRYRMGSPPGRDEYAAGHLPGAAYVDMDEDLAGASGDHGRHPLPDPAEFQAVMRRAGVSNDRGVVVYDDWAGRAAARCWWLLRWAGHRDVRVLDGGWSAWLDSGGAWSNGHDGPNVGDFTVKTGVLPVLRIGQVLRTARSGVLVDARAPERYRGQVEPVDPVAGHIPGAVNVPTETNLAGNGRFRTPDELRSAYANAGVEPDAEVAVYCGSGVTACHDILALDVIGVSATLYPGSWSEWVADRSRPVEPG